MPEGKFVADGSERIVLHYDLRTLGDGTLSSIDLNRAAVELSLANDFRIEMASDLQTDGEARNPEPVFLTFARAAGNVGDRSNGTCCELDYALPTAIELAGVNWHTVSNGRSIGDGRTGSEPSAASIWSILRVVTTLNQTSAVYATLRYLREPWTFYTEVFSIDDAYATSYWLTSSGIIRYKARVPQLYELVDDDDDSDAVTEWERRCRSRGH